MGGTTDVEEAAGGAAGSVPLASTCANDADCDDQLVCNGVEVCVDGACAAGTAVACAHSTTCLESTATCGYTDSSAWLVYQADEDTPGLDELYAVRQSLIGVQTPIKISASLPHAPLEHPTSISFVWSADGQWLSFGSTELNDTVSTRFYGVRFDHGIPQTPIALAGDLLAVSSISWSPTGHDLLVRGGWNNLYWVHLHDRTADAPVQINPVVQNVRYAFWATSGSILYVTYEGLAYRAVIDAIPLPSPVQMTSESPYSVEFGWASADGAWAVLAGTNRDWWLGNVNAGQIQRVTESALDPTNVSLQFSPNSRYLVYAAGEQLETQTELYLVDLNNARRSRIAVAQMRRAGDLLGTWSLDSSFFTYFGDPRNRQSGQRSINVYDVASNQSSGTNHDVGRDDGVVGFAPDRANPLYTVKHASTSSELVSIDARGRGLTFHEDAAGRTYSAAEFAADGSAALYCLTVPGDQLTDMVYQDRRGASPAQPVRLPGDGSVYSCSKGFAPDSKGFVYYRLAPDGARTLHWVDTTKQTMAKPKPISRDGRVQFYAWQPRAQAGN